VRQLWNYSQYRQNKVLVLCPLKQNFIGSSVTMKTTSQNCVNAFEWLRSVALKWHLTHPLISNTFQNTHTSVLLTRQKLYNISHSHMTIIHKLVQPGLGRAFSYGWLCCCILSGSVNPLVVLLLLYLVFVTTRYLRTDSLRVELVGCKSNFQVSRHRHICSCWLTNNTPRIPCSYINNLRIKALIPNSNGTSIIAIKFARSPYCCCILHRSCIFPQALF
jgi:hypothetical protein